MSIYVDNNWEQLPKATINTIDDAREFQVTYRNKANETFKVIFVKKLSPIGFRANLPGDKKK